MPILSNQANVTYNNGLQAYTGSSNIVTFNLNNPSLSVVKSQTPTAGIVGTTVTFTIVLTNTDIALALTNVILTDNLTAAGYTYVPNTLKVNGVLTAGSPETGINIGTILLLGVKTVTFDATVN